MGMEPSSLIIDYVVFAVAILACSLVAVWQKFRGPKETTKADYVFATGTVSMGAMMLSIARGTLGVRSFLGKRPPSSHSSPVPTLALPRDAELMSLFPLCFRISI